MNLNLYFMNLLRTTASTGGKVGSSASWFPSKAASRCVAITLFFAVTALWSSRVGAAEETAVTVDLQEQWHTVFSGRHVQRHVLVKAENPFEGRLVWELTADHRVIARGEKALTVPVGAPVAVAVELPIPNVKPGVVRQLTFTAAVVVNGKAKPVAALSKDLVILSDDPFFNKKQWLGQLNIQLFDPEQTAAAQLSEAGIPFRELRNIEALADIDSQFFIIAPNVSPADYPGLLPTVLTAAARGVSTIWLAPAPGQMPLPGTASSAELPEPKRIALRRNDMITELYAKLDAVAWPPDGSVTACSFTLTAERRQIEVDILENRDEWTWLILSYDGGGRFILCGVDIIGKWNASPTPRHLFAHMVAWATRKED